MAKIVSLNVEIESGGINVAMAVNSAEERKLLGEAIRRLESTARQKAKGYYECGESTLRASDSFVKIFYPEEWSAEEAENLVATLKEFNHFLSGAKKDDAKHTYGSSASPDEPVNAENRVRQRGPIAKNAVAEEINYSAWLETIPQNNQRLQNILEEAGISSDKEYREKEKSLPDKHRVDLAKFRFQHGVMISDNQMAPGGKDVRLLAAFAPVWVKSIPATHPGFPTRAGNVLSREGIRSFPQLTELSPDCLLRLNSFGRGTYKDLCRFLEHSLVEYAACELEEQRKEDERDSRSAKAMDSFQSIFTTILDLIEGPRKREIIRDRVGVDQEPKTLEAVGQKFEVCRERIRQVQADTVSKLHAAPEFVKIKDDIEREIAWQIEAQRGPIPLGEDCAVPFFRDVSPAVLKRFFQMILGTNYRILIGDGDDNAESAKIVFGVSETDLKQARDQLKKFMVDHIDYRRSTFMPEVYQYIEKEFDVSIHSDLKTYVDEWVNWDYSGDPKIISFGDSIDAAVAAVLERAGEPLSLNEIIKRARDDFGCDQNDGSIRNAVNALCAAPGIRNLDAVAVSLFQYGRSEFCTKRALPINPDELSYLVPGLVSLILEGRTSIIDGEPYQWHTADLWREINKEIPENELSELNPGIAWRAVDWLLRYHDPEGIVNLTKGFWVREVPGVRQTKRTQQEAVEYLLRNHSDARRLKRSELAKEFRQIQSVGAGYPFQGLRSPIVERDGEFFLDE